MPEYVQFVGNQGGQSVLTFYLGMAKGMLDKTNCTLQAVFITWTHSEKMWLHTQGVNLKYVACFEDFVANRHSADLKIEVEYLNQAYPNVNWSVIIAAERSFTDYSFLFGGAGNRTERQDYINRLLSNMVRFFENAYLEFSTQVVVTQAADTLFSFVAIKVAQHRGLAVRSIVPAWLLEPGKEGGFFAEDEYLTCRAMKDGFTALSTRELKHEEEKRVDVFKESILHFDGNTSFYKANNRNSNFLISPNYKRFMSYVTQNWKLNKDVFYTRFSLRAKFHANLIRLWRRYQFGRLNGSSDLSVIPKKSIFFAMHMQPELSTLTQGVWYSNQIALIENISKSLPIGYTLIIKEHPANRGFRPAWQYQHTKKLYNVLMCDAPSKDIVRSVQAVITITGTIGMESIVLRKPVILLGRTFYNFFHCLFRPAGIEELPVILRKILVDQSCLQGDEFEQASNRFLLAYLQALVPHFPQPRNGYKWGQYLVDELRESKLLN
jgi:hypothetical protein